MRMNSTTKERTMTKRLLSLAAALALAGCTSLAPHYERPAAPVAPAFTGESTTPGAQPASSIEWQSYFADERLKRLIDIALKNNRDLRVAVLNIEQARATYGIRRADWFPTVNAVATGTRQPET
jgi:outer membrane protein TolC